MVCSPFVAILFHVCENTLGTHVTHIETEGKACVASWSTGLRAELGTIIKQRQARQA